MDIIIKIIMIALISAVVENTIFTRAFGTSTMLIAAKNKKEILPFALSITYICTISSIFSFFADKFLLKNSSSLLYKPLIYVLIIGFVYIITLLILWKWAYKFFVYAKKFVHISAFNCAVLGGLLLNNIRSNSIVDYIGFGLGTGIGFLFAAFLVSACFEKLNSPKVPQSFRGFPATMIYIGILSMAFFALLGETPKI